MWVSEEGSDDARPGHPERGHCSEERAIPQEDDMSSESEIAERHVAAETDRLLDLRLSLHQR